MNHDHVRRLRRATWVTLVAGLAIAVWPAAANNSEPPNKTDWQGRYAAVLSRATAAEARIEANSKVQRKARQRERYQGEHRVEILAELEDAQKELAEAREIIAKFPDAARQAGVPPGWLREVEAR